MRSMRVDCGPVRIGSWDELVAYMDGSAGSVGRIMAPLLGVPGPPSRRTSGASASPSSTPTSSATCARTGRSTASTCRWRTASASGSPESDFARRTASPALRALVAHEVSRARGLFAAAEAGIAAAPPSVRPGIRLACAVYLGVLDRVEALGYDVLGKPPAGAGLAAPARGDRGAAPMTRRATLRGEQRTPLSASGRAPTCSCAGRASPGSRSPASWPGSGADVLVVDRYEIGERADQRLRDPDAVAGRARSRRAARQELPCMAFHTPHGSARFRLPWTWTAFDYRTLCEELWAQCGEARFEIATVLGVDIGVSPSAAPAAPLPATLRVQTDRGTLSAPLIVDALGWRRVLGAGENVQPPEARISRGLEVHPEGGGIDLDVWVDRSLVRRGYAWSVPARGEQRVGVGSYEPRDHVKEPTREIAERLGVPPVRYQGNWFPHELRPAVDDGVFFAGDSAGHCLPLSGEGIRTALYFGLACGRELRAVLAGEQTREQALERLRRVLRGPRTRLQARPAPAAADPGAAAAGADGRAGGGGATAVVPARVLVVPGDCRSGVCGGGAGGRGGAVVARARCCRSRLASGRTAAGEGWVWGVEAFRASKTWGVWRIDPNYSGQSSTPPSPPRRLATQSPQCAVRRGDTHARRSPNPTTHRT